MSHTFKPGDRVWFDGVKYTIEENDSASYPIRVDREPFTADGRYKIYHKKPILKPVKKKPKIVEKTRDAWVNIYPDFQVIHDSKEEADKYCSNGGRDRLALIPVTLKWKEEAKE